MRFCVFSAATARLFALERDSSWGRTMFDLTRELHISALFYCFHVILKCLPVSEPMPHRFTG